MTRGILKNAINLLVLGRLYMSEYRRRRQSKPEEPDWRSRESRGHSWFHNMKTEREKAKSGSFYRSGFIS